MAIRTERYIAASLTFQGDHSGGSMTAHVRPIGSRPGVSPTLLIIAEAKLYLRDDRINRGALVEWFTWEIDPIVEVDFDDEYGGRIIEVRFTDPLK